MISHCRTCSLRPNANLTELDGVLWSPECLYARSEQATHHSLPKEGESHHAHAQGVLLTRPPLTIGEAAGLRVVDGGLPKRRRPPKNKLTR